MNNKQYWLSNILKLSIIILSGFVISPVIANPTYGALESRTPYRVCFTPGANCTQLIVEAIQSAQHEIDVQAYSFTSAPIAKALIAAKRRGVRLRVLLDKSNVRSRYSIVTTFVNQGIPFLIDSKPAIAHNKIMIIDHKLVLTGSFNFTRSAERRNAENVIIINNKRIAAIYFRNFKKRFLASETLQAYKRRKHKHS